MSVNSLAVVGSEESGWIGQSENGLVQACVSVSFQCVASSATGGTSALMTRTLFLAGPWVISIVTFIRSAGFVGPRPVLSRPSSRCEPAVKKVTL